MMPSHRILRHRSSPPALSSTRPCWASIAATVHSVPSSHSTSPADNSTSPVCPGISRAPTRARPATCCQAGGTDRHPADGTTARAAHAHGQPPAALPPTGLRGSFAIWRPCACAGLPACRAVSAAACARAAACCVSHARRGSPLTAGLHADAGQGRQAGAEGPGGDFGQADMIGGRAGVTCCACLRCGPSVNGPAHDQMSRPAQGCCPPGSRSWATRRSRSAGPADSQALPGCHPPGG